MASDEYMIASGGLVLAVIAYAAWTAPRLAVAAAVGLGLLFAGALVVQLRSEFFGDMDTRLVTVIAAAFAAGAAFGVFVDPVGAQVIVIGVCVIGLARSVYEYACARLGSVSFCFLRWG
ncbi:hypothetical protein [Natrarchaeobaculum sulfurireducens]|uniref:Uncharacterized protein n=1 Tax=Natrarchaeobaculum sulfurireducens TaxID=2044521 RepID=A0A346PMF3_9EURY|nr:hypothetical protein [Natrarchaeobaculum sulfurireducens]AXR80698.1 hypothetical protein AArcMg_0676 [Natrarchaeobaculum sulfurireducens]